MLFSVSLWRQFEFEFCFLFFALSSTAHTAAVTVSSVVLSLLGNVPRRQPWASQPQKHTSYPLGKSSTQIHSENKNTLHYMLFTGIHSWLLMEISAIRLKRKGFNAQRKEAKAMKVHGLKNNKITKQLVHYIGKCNKCCWCTRRQWLHSADIEKKNYFSNMVSLRETRWYSADMLHNLV